MEVFRKVVTVAGTTNFIPANRAEQLVAADKAERKAIKENPTDNAGVTPTLDRMDIKEIDTETDYFAHTVKGTGATTVTEYKKEQPEEAKPQPAATPSTDIMELAKAIQALNAAAPAAEPAKEPAKGKAAAKPADQPAAGENDAK